MPLLQSKQYTSEDYWSLPGDERAELIHGQFYNMAPPTVRHQRLIAELTRHLGNYIEGHGGTCLVLPSPLAVCLFEDDTTWVESDVSVICDKSKLTERGCVGAPVIYPFDTAVAFCIYPDLSVTISKFVDGTGYF